MEKFRLSNVTGKLIEVPGIGDAAILKLASDPDPTERITNTHQLIGKYLMLKGPDENGESVSVFQTNQKFWYWLKMRGIVVHRSAIVLAISTKVSSFFPEFADPHADLDLDDDEE
jgi:hypothetical protein